ncbi:MAG: hypothetical protein ACRCV3_01025 [Desulfovibrionaceae bacterium]
MKKLGNVPTNIAQSTSASISTTEEASPPTRGRLQHRTVTVRTLTGRMPALQRSLSESNVQKRDFHEESNPHARSMSPYKKLPPSPPPKPAKDTNMRPDGNRTRGLSQERLDLQKKLESIFAQGPQKATTNKKPQKNESSSVNTDENTVPTTQTTTPEPSAEHTPLPTIINSTPTTHGMVPPPPPPLPPIQTTPVVRTFAKVVIPKNSHPERSSPSMPKGPQVDLASQIANTAKKQLEKMKMKKNEQAKTQENTVTSTQEDIPKASEKNNSRGPKPPVANKPSWLQRGNKPNDDSSSEEDARL